MLGVAISIVFVSPKERLPAPLAYILLCITSALWQREPRTSCKHYTKQDALSFHYPAAQPAFWQSFFKKPRRFKTAQPAHSRYFQPPLPIAEFPKPAFSFAAMDNNGALTLTNAGVYKSHRRPPRAYYERKKTGCKTCRTRKKRCDEARPRCGNCTRAAFACEWSTPVETPPVPHEQQQQQQQRYHHHRLRGEARPSTATSAEPLAIALAPILPRSSPPSRQSVTAVASLQAISPPAPIEPRPSPPSRLSVVASASLLATVPPAPIEPRPSPPSRHSTTAAANLLAISLAPIQPRPSPPPGAASGPLLRRRAAEVDEVVRPRPGYAHFAAPNAAKRAERAVVVAQFNAAADPLLGVSEGEIREKLREVVGRLGADARVEAPFWCDYGANVEIGDNVVVQSGCRIADAGPVRIGEDSIIGAGVVIDTYRRHGVGGHSDAVGVWIGKNVLVGGGSFIGPGTVLDDDSIIPANSYYPRPKT